MSYANNKGADQPAHPRYLISAFVVRCLDSVMSLVSVTKISSLTLASVAEQAGLSLTWSETPEDTFSHDEAQLYIVKKKKNEILKVKNVKSSVNWATSSEFGTYCLWEQRRFRRACASAQSRQNLRCSLIQAVSREEPSDRKLDPLPLWMTGHAQLKFVMTECSKTQICLMRPNFIFSAYTKCLQLHKQFLGMLQKLLNPAKSFKVSKSRGGFYVDIEMKMSL